MPEYVRAGESITLPWGPDREPMKIVVSEACNLGAGHWMCVPCQEGFDHNMAAMSHYTGSDKLHRFVWICNEHGPEPPL